MLLCQDGAQRDSWYIRLILHHYFILTGFRRQNKNWESIRRSLVLSGCQEWLGELLTEWNTTRCNSTYQQVRSIAVKGKLPKIKTTTGVYFPRQGQGQRANHNVNRAMYTFHVKDKDRANRCVNWPLHAKDKSKRPRCSGIYYFIYLDLGDGGRHITLMPG